MARLPLPPRRTQPEAFVPDLRPLYFVSMVTGTGHSPSNPGGIPGNWLADPAAADAGYMELLHEGGFKRGIYHVTCGAAPGEDYCHSTFDTMVPQMQTYFGTQKFWDPAIEWAQYVGTMMPLGANPSTSQLTMGGTPPGDYAFPTPAFSEKALAPWRRLGISTFFVDAAASQSPSRSGLYTNANCESLLNSIDRHEVSRLSRPVRCGTEPFPHTLANQSLFPGQFNLLPDYQAVRPYLAIYNVWYRFYRDTIPVVPPGCEFHVIIPPGALDYVVGPDQPVPPIEISDIELLHERGYCVGFQHDFKNFFTNPVAYTEFWEGCLDILKDQSARTPVRRKLRSPSLRIDLP